MVKTDLQEAIRLEYSRQKHRFVPRPVRFGAANPGAAPDRRYASLQVSPTVPLQYPAMPMCASTYRSAAIPRSDTINRKCRRLAPFSAGSILAQDKGPHRFGGTSRAQSPAVRSFYGTRKPNRFSGKPLDSAPLTKENSDFARRFGYHEQIGCFLQQQSNCKGRLQIIERAFSRMDQQPRNMKGHTR